MTAASPSGDRLNKYLALELGISRREADNYIAAGRVTVNDNVAILGTRVQLDDLVAVDGNPIQGRAELIYLALHKPSGYLSSRRSQGDIPTLYELLPKKYHTLKPVGRLDKDSSGLLLLTNDGDFAYQMTHPRFYKIKKYQVELDRELEPLHQQMISDHGIQLEDGVSKFMIEKLDQPKEQASVVRAPAYLITMSEGRNRQIRRTFLALGYTVTGLHRTHFGNYSLGDMKPGEHKVIDIS